jgi:hypothetical protein
MPVSLIRRRHTSRSARPMGRIAAAATVVVAATQAGRRRR